jgi:hypothetical protein
LPSWHSEWLNSNELAVIDLRYVIKKKIQANNDSFKAFNGKSNFHHFFCFLHHSSQSTAFLDFKELCASVIIPSVTMAVKAYTYILITSLLTNKEQLYNKIKRPKWLDTEILLGSSE